MMRISPGAVMPGYQAQAGTQAIFLLATAFVVVAPLAQTGLLATPMKLLRISICLALLWFGRHALQGLTKSSMVLAWLAFWSCFSAAAIWSEAPLVGLLLKGTALLAFLAGVVLGRTVGTTQQLQHCTRYLTVAALLGAAAIATMGSTGRANFEVVGRLSVANVNAVFIGISIAPMVLVCLYQFLVEQSRVWKMVAALAGVVSLILLLGTGSRGSLVAAVLGFLTMFACIRRGRLPLLICVALAIPAVFWLLQSPDGSLLGIDRMLERGAENTRDHIWAFGWNKIFSENPVIGTGWLTWNGKSSASLMNVGLQVLAETGTFGGLLFAGVMTGLLVLLVKGFFGSRFHASGTPHAGLVVGGLVTIMVCGVFESALLFGTTSHTLLFGMFLAILERMTATRRTVAHAR